LFDDWGYEDDDTKRPVQVYSVNVPLVPEVLTVENRKTCFTHMYRNTYGQLFKPTTKQSGAWNPADVDDANPDADVEGDGALRFAFAPNLHPILFPETLPEGTDAWAFHHGYTSVTPFRAAYDGLSDTGSGFGSGHPDGPFW
jgi:broad specificity polyphosphatase/5'/3'-nucleotidase SurE